jgi:hypothetical protein
MSARSARKENFDVMFLFAIRLAQIVGWMGQNALYPNIGEDGKNGHSSGTFICIDIKENF